MRTSNKILLGGFLAALLIVIGVHIALYAKIKSGDLVVLGEEQPVLERVELGQIKHVVVKGFREVRIIPSDSTRLEIIRGGADLFRIWHNEDSAVIEAKVSDQELAAGSRIYLPIILYLPNEGSIRSMYSQIFLRGGEDSSRAVSQKIALINSELNLDPMQRTSETGYWGNLTINGHNDSHIFCFPGGFVKNMDISLGRDSRIHDNGSKFEKFTLQLDSTSSADLHTSTLELLKQQQ